MSKDSEQGAFSGLRRAAQRVLGRAPARPRSSPGIGSGQGAGIGELNDEEARLRDLLLAGNATLDEGLRLYSSITARGLGFPIAWEEIVLGLGLRADPLRADLKARLRHVLRSQGKPVPEDLEQWFSAHAAQEERARDHQQDAADYHAKTGMIDMDAGFAAIYEACRSYSMTSVERMYALYLAVRYIHDAGIEGDLVECGVWRGGSMMVAARTLLALGSTSRNLYLYDTYEGLPRPDESKDVDVWGNRAIDGWLPRSVDDERSHWAEAGLDEVRSNLASTGYPAERLQFVKGMVERTIPETAPARIAILRLDTDWYESTRHELNHLYDRISLNGVLILDDYGHFKGARDAVDEFLRERRIPLLLHRVDYAGRVAIKITA